MAKKGEEFVDLVFGFAKNHSTTAKKQILGILEGYAKGVFDKNDVMNKFGDIENCSLTGQDTKVIVSRALVYYANHDSLISYVHINPDKEYYANIIISALVECTEGKTLAEAYSSMGNFIR